MWQILKYIVKNNHFISIPKYLILGSVFQFFKRVTNSIISKQIFNEKMLFLYPKCNVSSMYTYTAIPDRKEIMSIRKLASKDTVFLDVGANIGSYSISMMDLCEEVIAFEPHPYTAMRCKMNFLLNGKPEEMVKQMALSNKVGNISFSDYGGSSTINHILNDSNGIKVEVTTLDDFIVEYDEHKSKQYILKVDVEGFEKQVFEGGKVFLSDYCIRGILFECFSPQHVLDLLKSYGYQNIIKVDGDNYLATKD